MYNIQSTDKTRIQQDIVLSECVTILDSICIATKIILSNPDFISLVKINLLQYLIAPINDFFSYITPDY